MDTSDLSLDNSISSEEDMGINKLYQKTMSLRERPKKSYKEADDNDDEDYNEDQSENAEFTQNLQNPTNNNNQDFNSDKFNDDQGEGNLVETENPNYEESNIFSHEVDQILWRRSKINADILEYEYLIKLKDLSFLHCKWINEAEILAEGKSAKNKLNRFNKSFDIKFLEQEIDYDEITGEPIYFDPQFIEVDRILHTTELFPIIHPKKANEIKGKWSESIMMIVTRLLNYTKNNVNYGVYFMDPVDPEKDGVPNYRRIIQNPMDLGTLLNRIYLDFYKTSQQFWQDFGLIFKNCRKYNKEENSDIRILNDTLRELAIDLYKKWYAYSKTKYEQMLNDFKQKNPSFNPNLSQINLQDPNELKKLMLQRDIQKREEEMSNIIYQFQLFQNQQVLNNNLATQQLPLLLQQFIQSNPMLFNPTPFQFNNNNYGMQPQNQQLLLQQANEISQLKKNEFIKRVLNLSQQQQNNIQIQIANRINNDIEQKQVQNNSIESAQLILLLKEIEQFNPGQYNFSWLEDDSSGSVERETLKYFTEDELKDIELFKETDRLYLVKWKNQSYLDATWELESLINSPQKINDFKLFNRALDKENRNQMISQCQRHKELLDILTNSKKRVNQSSSHIMDLKNKLYKYDVAQQRRPPQYNPKTQPIFKDRKLLRDYQLDSLNWLIQAWYHKRNTILADEMGLGKTIQSISFLNHLITFEGVRGPFLIIAPLSTLEHWKRTVEDWTNLNGILYYDKNSAEGRATIRLYEWYYTDISTKGNVLTTQELFKFQIIITSYEVFLQDLSEVFLQVPFQFIVVDEAHRLKNQNAKILTSLKTLPCKRILLLTGTPIQNNTEELWTLLNYIEPDKFNSLMSFRENFGDLSKAEQVEKLHEILKPFLLRRMKEDVEASIPPLMETIIDVEMTLIQKKIYRALYERNKAMLKGFSGQNFTTSLNNLEMQLRKCCNHPFLIKDIEQEITKDSITQEQRFKKLIESSGKMILLDKLLPKLKCENKKLLIFSQFTYMLNILEDYLQCRGYKYEKIDGSIKAKERQSAIDRFNNPEKKRDVFLLSTKAGGIGINLTSANVVVIYDSDWNPQNDVQATARAHRIGQMNEVQVYRLITANTYESEMFERASKKLGLDQAIFMGGAFQGNQNQIAVQNNKQELETLLKKGIIGFLDKDQEKLEAFMEDNIDEILKKNSRVAKYSLVNGTYSFSKSKFVSQQSDASINLDDPNFWDKILKNQESKTKLLLDQLHNDKSILTNFEKQKEFMLKISENVNELIQNKVNILAFNADDDKHITDLLQDISNLKQFHQHYKDLASQWMYEVIKPSRKFKQILPSDLEVNFKSPNITIRNAIIRTRQSSKVNNVTTSKVPTNNIVQDDSEKIYNEENDENFVDDDNLLQSQDSDNDSVLDPNRATANKQKDEYLKKLCCYCERMKCTIFCQGHCKRAFHEFCREQVESGSICGLDQNSILYDLNELEQDEEKLKKNINTSYICSDCQNNMAICFQCKKKAKFIPGESTKSKSKSKSNKDKQDSTSIKDELDKIDIEEESESNQFKKESGTLSELVKCSTANCNKFYHLECIKDNPLFKYFDANKNKKFRCSLHYCKKCSTSGDIKALAQCFRCPNAYHFKCSAKEKIVRLTKKIMLCPEHKIDKIEKDSELSNNDQDEPTKKQKISNLRNTQPPKEKLQQKKATTVTKSTNIINNTRQQSNKTAQSETSSLKNMKLKTKYDSMFESEDSFFNMKIKKKTRNQEKQEKKLQEKFNKIKKLCEIDIIVNNEVVVQNLTAILPKSTYLSDNNSDITSSTNNQQFFKQIKKKFEKEKIKISFSDFGLESPTNDFYINYTQDWCRYCGARYSSNFTKGPWGPRTLCTIHYIEWNQKKKLNLSAYKDLPQSPIDLTVNTELNYLANMRQKSIRYDNTVPNLGLLDIAQKRKIRGNKSPITEEINEEYSLKKISNNIQEEDNQLDYNPLQNQVQQMEFENQQENNFKNNNNNNLQEFQQQDQNISGDQTNLNYYQNNEPFANENNNNENNQMLQNKYVE